MSIARRRGVCLHCGHDHDAHQWDIRALAAESNDRIAELERLLSEANDNLHDAGKALDDARGNVPCCGKFDTCENRCIPLIQNLRKQLAEERAKREAAERALEIERDKRGQQGREYCYMRDAILEFCERVERGEVRSKYTYAKFKDALAQQRKESDK